MKLIDNIKTALSGKETDIALNTDAENKMLSEIISNQEAAATKRRDIETIWDDEYKIFKGDQWDLSFAKRSKDSKQIRPNSIDNFVFPAVMNLYNTLTATTPDPTLEVSDGDDSTDDTELEEKITDNVANILEKNKFPQVWKKIVFRGISHGPFIGAVLWDNDWVGGTGPNRWVGEVRVIAQKKEEIFFDPAIIDLEERLQECSFIHRKFRKKLSYFADKWEKGELVLADNNEDGEEGIDHEQAWLIESWHKGKPQFMPKERKAELLQKAQSYLPPSMTIDEFAAEKYKQMAAGKINGVHVAYATQNVFLEYVPYAYDDGLYPFVYKTLYTDYKSPYGFGEIRNIMVPQVMHNKADEIEIEAMSVEGLGGAYYSKGAVDNKQLAFIEKNSSKGGMWAEVNNATLIKERTGAKVPPSIREYKEHKQRMVETISKNTPIQQGMSPGANVPLGTIKELGARTDIGTKGKGEILEDFLKEMILLISNRIKEFYTEERTYKIRGQQDILPNVVKQLQQIAQMPDSPEKAMAALQAMNQLNTPKPKYSTFSNREMLRKWERKPAVLDPVTKQVVEPAKTEGYMPDFTSKVKIIDERPTDRNYYLQIADKLMSMGILDAEDFLFVVEEGKLPPKELILQKYEKRKQEAMQQQQQVMQMKQQEMGMKQQAMQQKQQPQEQPQQPDEAQIEQFLQQLPPEIMKTLQSMPEEQRLQGIQEMMQLNPQELQQYLSSMGGK
jgi:hypothetical protein